jgi:hypothetical protein
VIEQLSTDVKGLVEASQVAPAILWAAFRLKLEM